jgi:hypothetical protein
VSSALPQRSKFEEPRLLRKLADLVARYRNALRSNELEVDGAGSVLSTTIYLFALKLLEEWQLQEVAGGNSGLPFPAAKIGDHMARLHARLNDFTPEDARIKLSAPHPGVADWLWHSLAAEELTPLWSDPRLIGYVYQYFFAEHRKASQRRIQTANKELSAAQLIAFTQLYTPSWVTHYLLQNTLWANAADRAFEP